MGSIGRRLEVLEAQVRAEVDSGASEEQDKRAWLLRARLRHNRARPYAVESVRDLIRLFRTQGVLSRMGEEDLINRILAWRPSIEGLTQRTAEREVALAAYSRELGTEHMSCPKAWLESFEAGEELRRRYEDIPERVLAGAYARILKAPKGEDEEQEALEECMRTLDNYGVTAELQERAIGPDIEEI